MSSIPVLQIHQTPGLIGIDADMGQFSIQQPKADMQIDTQSAQLDIHQYRPELHIDQSRALAAYVGGGHLEMTKRLYSTVQELFLQGIAKRVEEGNRMAQYYKPGNTIEEIVGNRGHDPSFGEFRGPASSANVDIHVERHEPDIEVEPVHVNIQVNINKPIIEYTRGKLDIYMQQYPSVQFTPPALDTLM
jgi:hypothetical protein